MTKKIVINSTCIGCGMCISVAPEFFEMNDEGQAQPIANQRNKCDEDEVQEAIEMCPVQAIKCKEE